MLLRASVQSRIVTGFVYSGNGIYIKFPFRLSQGEMFRNKCAPC